MSPLSKLSEILSTLPGIGPRHAERLAYFISAKNGAFINNFKKALEEVHAQGKRCTACRAVFYSTNPDIKSCLLCKSKNRENGLLIVTDTEINRNSIEKSGVTNGRYFILGNTIPMTDADASRLPISELINRIKELSKSGLQEIILAFSYTPEGEHTGEVLKKKIANVCKENKIKISNLGRGFSAGMEVEYSDTDTLKHAFKNRFHL